MNALSREELAALYVFDQLDAPDRAAFEARLAREPDLAALIRELETTLARTVRSLPPQEPPDDLLARIEQRLDAQTVPSSTASRAPIFPLPSRAGVAGLLRWGLAAVIALSLATLAVQSLRRPAAPPVFVFVGLDARHSTFAELPARATSADADDRFLQIASLAEKFWQEPAALPVKTSADARARRGYALFDPTSRQGFIAVAELPPLPAAQRYHLWIVDGATGSVRDAGALPLADATGGLYTFSAEAADHASPARLRFLVTAEDARSIAQHPRGPVLLGDPL